MASSLEDKIIEDLEKTGYPAEIVSAAVMQSRDWAVLHNPSYIDDTERRSREFDIRAYKHKTTDTLNKPYSAGVYLITECKKSDKPWIFFTSPENHSHSRIGSVMKWALDNAQVFTDRSNNDALISDNYLRGFHHYFKTPRLARTFHQAFRSKESEHAQMIYSAVMSVVKATLFSTRPSRYSSDTWLRLFYPVVVFSGELFEAQVDSDKKIALLPSRHLQLSFNYFTPGSSTEFEKEFIIDIVHEKYLVEFLKLVEAELETLSMLFFDSIEKKKRTT